MNNLKVYYLVMVKSRN